MIIYEQPADARRPAPLLIHSPKLLIPIASLRMSTAKTGRLVFRCHESEISESGSIFSSLSFLGVQLGGEGL